MGHEDVPLYVEIHYLSLFYNKLGKKQSMQLQQAPTIKPKVFSLIRWIDFIITQAH